MYTLPKFNSQKVVKKIIKNEFFQGAVLLVIIAGALAFASGEISTNYIEKIGQQLLSRIGQEEIRSEEKSVPAMYVSKFEYEQAIIDVVSSASPSVVSIVISKNVPVYEQELIPFEGISGLESPFLFQVPRQVQKGTKFQEVGQGSGFIVSEDGLILTNKHVVIDKTAEYKVITNGGGKYTAKVVALDPVQDLAIIKIQDDNKFPAIKLGDSNGIKIGQGAIAIGNALGEFNNTVSVGVISGLQRTVSASGEGGFSETLEGIIQTDAAINQGNSGGPLLNLMGEVIGVNTAVATGAQSIGFAIPINIVKRDIDQILKTNKITYPFLGVRYLLIDEELKAKYKLSVDAGALIIKGDKGETAITKDSPADKAGLKEKDVVLEMNGEKIALDNSMIKILQKYMPGDKVTLKILRDKKEIMVDVVLSERN